MPQMNRAEAVAAANFRVRTGVKNAKAIRRLAQWGAELGIFNVDKGPKDDWEAYAQRCQHEREHDPVATIEASPFKEKAEHAARELAIQEKEAQFLRANPEIAIRRMRAAANTTDRASIDYQDPKDFNRTKLHKAVIDNNLPECKRLIEECGATTSLFLRDSDGFTPIGIAENEGFFTVARYLREQKTKAQPPAKPTAKSA